MENIGFCVDNAMKIIAIMIFVNFANKSIQILEILRMMINGSVVMNATDG